MLPILVCLPFVSAFLFMVLSRQGVSQVASRVLAVATAAGCFGMLALMVAGAGAGETISFAAPWIPTFGLNFSLWLDGPAIFWGFLVLGLGTLIFLYAAFYLEADDSPWRFFGTMVFFMGAMLGVVLSRNILLMVVFWELTSISSFILIGHWHHKASARAGALRALITTGAGGLCLIAGVAVLAVQLTQAGVPLAQALEWDALWANRDIISDGSPLSLAGMILLLLGAFTKSAQFPFHYWLPGAMEAPTPVSAFLHAATMVKAGIYLLGRMYPIYSDSPYWLVILGSVGVLTMVVGGFMAMTSRDLKQLLAHSTVSQLGLLTAYYGFGHGLMGSEGKQLPLDLMMVASHAFFKGALFMLIGVLDHGLHTRDWTRMGGLLTKMPVTATLMIIATWSMAGLPLTLGFLAKELFLKKALALQTEGFLLYALPAVAIFASAFTMAYCLRLTISPFFGKPRDPSIHPHEGGPGLLFSPAVLVVLCLVGAWAPIPEALIGSLVNPGYFGTTSGFTLAMFHMDILLAIAGGLLVTGGVIFLLGVRIDGVYTSLGRPEFFAGTYAAIFDKFIPNFAKWLFTVCQAPALSRNATISIAVPMAVLAVAIWHSGWWPTGAIELDSTLLPALLFVVLTAVSAFVVTTHPILLVRIIALTPVGFFVALFFVFYKAPDLALTQILVEIVVVVVLLLLLYIFPQKLGRTRLTPATMGRAAIAISGGLLMALITFGAMTGPGRDNPTLDESATLAQFYLENTKLPLGGLDPDDVAAGYPGLDNPRAGGGYNTVNVILVDFRGIDTFGEISVLAIAALGALMLLGYGRQTRTSADDGPPLAWKAKALEGVDDLAREGTNSKPGSDPIVAAPTWPSPSLILSEAGRLAPAVMIAIAMVLFFAGHNAPGGGFIAGLMASVAIAVMFISFRRKTVEALRDFNYANLIAWGLGIALLTGIAAMVMGYPFLTGAYDYFYFPLVGEVELASAALFDLGVFLVVVGVTLSIVERFGRE